MVTVFDSWSSRPPTAVTVVDGLCPAPPGELVLGFMEPSRGLDKKWAGNSVVAKVEGEHL